MLSGMSPLPIAMVIVVDPSQEAIETSVTRTESPPADTPISTGECRDRSFINHIAGAVEVNLEPMYDEQAETML